MASPAPSAAVVPTLVDEAAAQETEDPGFRLGFRLLGFNLRTLGVQSCVIANG